MEIVNFPFSINEYGFVKATDIWVTDDNDGREAVMVIGQPNNFSTTRPGDSYFNRAITVNEFVKLIPSDVVFSPGAPVAPGQEGIIYVNKTNNECYRWDGASFVLISPSAAGGYTTIQEEGANLPSRPTMNFVGPNITATDNGSETIITVTDASGQFEAGSGGTSSAQQKNTSSSAGAAGAFAAAEGSANGVNSAAINQGSSVDGENSTAVAAGNISVAATNSFAAAAGSVIVGDNAAGLAGGTAGNNEAFAASGSSVADGFASTAVAGGNTTSDGTAQFAANPGSIAKGENSAALAGGVAEVTGNGSFASGNGSIAEAPFSVAFNGGKTNVDAFNSIAVGPNAQTFSDKSSAAGQDTVTGWKPFLTTEPVVNGVITIPGLGDLSADFPNGFPNNFILIKDPASNAIKKWQYNTAVYSAPNFIITLFDTTLNMPGGLPEIKLANTKFLNSPNANSFSVEGSLAEVSGRNSISIGFASTAIGNGTVAAGDYSTASGDNSVAGGSISIAKGSSTFAAGDASEASNSQTRAMGFATTAHGLRSSAKRFGEIAHGTVSHTQATYGNGHSIVTPNRANDGNVNSELFLDGGVSNSQRIWIYQDSFVYFDVDVFCVDSLSPTKRAMLVNYKGVIQNIGGTVSITGTGVTETLVYETSIGMFAALTGTRLTADNVNKSLKLEFGLNDVGANLVRWQAKAKLIQTGYSADFSRIMDTAGSNP